MDTPKLEELDQCSVCCAWIAPDGKASYLGVHGGSHCEVAEALGDKTGGTGLETKGYLHVSYGRVDTPGVTATQAQLDTLWDMMVELNRRAHWSAHSIESYLTKHQEKVSA